MPLIKWSLAGVILIAVVTPGPNNLIVWRIAADRGVSAAAPAIIGVVLGSLLLMTLAFAGVGAVVALAPEVRLVVSLVGGLYLAWLGVRLAFPAGGAAGRGPALPGGLWGLVGFQLVNPKAWLMAIATVPVAGTGAAAFAGLAILYTAIPAACLTLWAVGGAALTDWLGHGTRVRWHDRLLGSLLIGCAAALVLEELW